MGKYDPLRRFLEDTAPGVFEVTLSLGQIEQILGDTLPHSAEHYRPWWGNELRSGIHVQASSWLDAGWEVDEVEGLDRGGHERDEKRERGSASGEWVSFRVLRVDSRISWSRGFGSCDPGIGDSDRGGG